MSADLDKMLLKARASLEAAIKLFEDEYYGFSTSRAYYAMFYAAEAILLNKGLAFSKHSGVISALGQYFVKSGIIPQEYHKMLRDAFRARNIGDYMFDEDVTETEAKTILVNAGIFLDLADDILARG